MAARKEKKVEELWPTLRWERDTLPELVEATLEHILERTADGERLRVICKTHGWPYSQVARWIAQDDGRNASYEQALKLWADDMAQESLEIADDSKNAEDGTGVSSAKLRVDTRMKLASRWHRHRYGETPSLQINAQGGSLISILQGLPPVVGPEEKVVSED